MDYISGNLQELKEQLSNDQEENFQAKRQIEEQVAEIIQQVRSKKDAALKEYTLKFDSIELSDFQVTKETIEKAIQQLDKKVYEALKKAKENILSFHKHQVEEGFIDTQNEGVIRGQMVLPIEKVGIYVPGGTAAYPSSVLMNALPAKLAGVKEIIMITPPSKNNELNPAILAAAELAGVTAIFQVGGAHGIAALAYGTETIPKVDKIVGPGNSYVAEAKKQLFGQVGIDMIAGPSEIGILADQQANPAYIAADLLSQAEHDEWARAILVTNSKGLAEKVQKEVALQLEKLPRKAIAEKAINNHGKVIVTNSIDEMFEVMNEIAPEHLEIQLSEPMNYLGKVKHAGSVFLGEYASEPVGDYFAGSNHVLPTSGTARFYSPLGVHDFIKRTQFIHYTKDALTRDSQYITTLAYQEGLQAHGKAIEIRSEKKQ